MSDRILSVYAGHNHRCCCGCSGTHWYSERTRREAGIMRGYPVEDSEVNEAVFKKIKNKVLRSKKSKKQGSFIELECGGLLYLVYLKENKK